MSSFVRRQFVAGGAAAGGGVGAGGLRAAAVDTGTRAGLHGATLVSTGIADLDTALGGGLPLGSLTLVLEDSHSRQADALVRFFLAEGLACGHSCCWLAPAPPAGGAGAALPPVAVPRAAEAGAGPGSGASAAASAATATAAVAGGSGADGGDGLRIAWQYRKYIQQSQHGDGPQRLSGRAVTSSSSSSSGSGGGGGSSSASAAASSFKRAGAASSAGAGGATTAAAARALAAGTSREWCHRFDTMRGVGDDAIAKANLLLQTSWRTDGSGDPALQATAAGLDFLSRLPAKTAPIPQPAAATGEGAAAAAADAATPPADTALPQGTPLPPRAPAEVGRLVVQSLGSGSWARGRGWMDDAGGGDGGGDGGSSSSSGSGAPTEAAVLHAIARLRLAAHDARCAVLVTCPAECLPFGAAARLPHLADATLALAPLADDSEVARLVPDAASAVALLRVVRLPGAALARPRVPEHPLYVVRASRRRGLALTAFEVDPDAEAAAQGGGGGGGSGGGGGGGGAAAMLCGGPGGESKLLSF